MKDRRPFDKSKRPAGKPARPDARRDGKAAPAGRAPHRDKRDDKRDGKPRDAQSRDAKPYGAKPYAGKPGGGKPYKAKPADGKPARDKRPQRDGKPFGGKPQRDDRPRDDNPRSARSGSDRPRNDRPRNDKPQWNAKPPRRERPALDAKPQDNRLPAEPKAPGLRLTPALWGVHAAAEAWLNPKRNIFSFAATEAALIEFQDTLAKGRALGLKRPEPMIVERLAIDRLLPAGTVHQGLVVDAAPLEEVFVQDLVVRAAALDRAVILVLDQVTDPHNIGAILRSASAFGATGIVMQSRNAPEMSGVIAKAASGAAEHMPIAYETNLSRAVNFLQAEGFTAIGLDERGEKTLAESNRPAKTVILLGAEGKGLRHNLREHCDMLVRLPTQGAILSLNVSNAAAVALYALSV